MFGKDGGVEGEYDGEKEKIIGRVAQIKASPEKGKKRIIVKKKTGMRKSVGIDVEAKNATHIKRKQDIMVEAIEKIEHSYSGRPKAGGFKTYVTDDRPEPYVREKNNGGFKQFGENSNMKGSDSRMKF